MNRPSGKDVPDFLQGLLNDFHPTSGKNPPSHGKSMKEGWRINGVDYDSLEDVPLEARTRIQRDMEDRQRAKAAKEIRLRLPHIELDRDQGKYGVYENGKNLLFYVPNYYGEDEDEEDNEGDFAVPEDGEDEDDDPDSRPPDKVFRVNGRAFSVGYYHDGQPISVYEIDS